MEGRSLLEEAQKMPRMGLSKGELKGDGALTRQLY